MTRWIVIGHMRADWYVIAQGCGCPGGYYVHWKGRDHPFQPSEFFRWNDLLWALDRKLALAGLERVELVRRVVDFWEELRVLVKRGPKLRFKGAQAA